MANELTTLLEQQKTNILVRFPKLNDWLTPEIWWSIVQQLENDPKLAKAAKENPNSMLAALLTLADWGLKPDRSEAFINVYEITQYDGKKLLTAQAQWIWQGGVRRAIDSGVIAHAVADVVRKGDTIEEVVDFKKGRYLTHKRNLEQGNRPLVGAYALFWLRNGLMDYELCDLEDIERAKKASMRQTGGKITPAWEYAYPEQAKKTAIRRGLKRMVGARDKGFADMVDTHTLHDIEMDGAPPPPDNLPNLDDYSDVADGHLSSALKTNLIMDDLVADEKSEGGETSAGDGQAHPSTPSATVNKRQADWIIAYAQKKGVSPETLEDMLRGEPFNITDGEFPDLYKLPADLLPALKARLDEGK